MPADWVKVNANCLNSASNAEVSVIAIWGKHQVCQPGMQLEDSVKASSSDISFSLTPISISMHISRDVLTRFLLILRCRTATSGRYNRDAFVKM